MAGRRRQAVACRRTLGLSAMPGGSAQGVGRLGAGAAGVAGLVSTLPWPELFSPGAKPVTAIAIDPGLKVVLLAHYAILVMGGALGLAAAVMLVIGLRQGRAGIAGAVLIAAGAAVFAYAATVRTFPPPSDYLLAIWFIGLGWKLRAA